MSRRNITYAVLLVASVVMTACAQPLAPSRGDTACKTYIQGTGDRCIQ